jgi:hypothetical protein
MRRKDMKDLRWSTSFASACHFAVVRRRHPAPAVLALPRAGCGTARLAAAGLLRRPPVRPQGRPHRDRRGRCSWTRHRYWRRVGCRAGDLDDDDAGPLPHASRSAAHVAERAQARRDGPADLQDRAAGSYAKSSGRKTVSWTGRCPCGGWPRGAPNAVAGAHKLSGNGCCLTQTRPDEAAQAPRRARHSGDGWDPRACADARCV